MCIHKTGLGTKTTGSALEHVTGHTYPFGKNENSMLFLRKMNKLEKYLTILRILDR